MKLLNLGEMLGGQRTNCDKLQWDPVNVLKGFLKKDV